MFASPSIEGSLCKIVKVATVAPTSNITNSGVIVSPGEDGVMMKGRFRSGGGYAVVIVSCGDVTPISTDNFITTLRTPAGGNERERWKEDINNYGQKAQEGREARGASERE